MLRQQYTLAKGQHITDLNLEINPDHALTRINAGTGTGKTTWLLKQFSIRRPVVFVVPQVIQIQQLEKTYAGDHRIAFLYAGKHSSFRARAIIISTYDQLPFILEEIKAEDYTLVVDEVHKLVSSRIVSRQSDGVSA